MTPEAKRIRRKRALDKAGFRHISGHLPAEQARKVEAMIDAAKTKVDQALQAEVDTQSGTS